MAHIGFNSASGLGPIIGGLLTSRVGWRSIFWFFAIFSGCVLSYASRLPSGNEPEASWQW